MEKRKNLDSVIVYADLIKRLEKKITIEDLKNSVQKLDEINMLDLTLKQYENQFSQILMAFHILWAWKQLLRLKINVRFG